MGVDAGRVVVDVASQSENIDAIIMDSVICDLVIFIKSLNSLNSFKKFVNTPDLICPKEELNVNFNFVPEHIYV